MKKVTKNILCLLDLHFYLLIKDKDRDLYQIHKNGFIKDLNALLKPEGKCPVCKGTCEVSTD